MIMWKGHKPPLFLFARSVYGMGEGRDSFPFSGTEFLIY